MAGFDLNSLLNGKSKGAAGQKQETAVAGQGPAEGQESSFEVVMLDTARQLDSVRQLVYSLGCVEIILAWH